MRVASRPVASLHDEANKVGAMLVKILERVCVPSELSLFVFLNQSPKARD
jgi:hypothetical protein